MQLGMVHVGGVPDFAVREDDGCWVPLASLGLYAPDTATAIATSTEVRAALTAGHGHALTAPVRLGCPVVRPGKILAIGLNYLDHIRETGAEKPDRPVVFAKYPSSLNGPFDPVVLDPDCTDQLDYEAELAVVIGRRTRRTPVEQALDGVFGYAVANDVSARDWQVRDGQFSRSKSMDTFCPIGPWITTADEVPDPQALGIRSDVNGERRQDSSTSQMLYGVAELLAFLSTTMTLEPGDVVLTGTPPGVGFGRKPPVFLQAGDVVACEIEGLGRIQNWVVSPAEALGVPQRATEEDQ
jgi:2-keto-4-pentenoate hydratase/2-oxohepta-3-ene-1,7-dioic acid hydratase in catechol pathway